MRFNSKGDVMRRYVKFELGWYVDIGSSDTMLGPFSSRKKAKEEYAKWLEKHGKRMIVIDLARRD